MFKKNSWIVALLLALSLTVFFISCVDPLAEEEGEETYTEVALGKFNQWGGLKASQAGWAVAGIVSNEGIVAKDLGYKLEDFQKARYLVVTTSTDNPGGVDLIWASADEDGNDIGPNWMKKDGVQNAPVGSFDKATKELKIDLKKGITDKNFRAATTKKVKILLQHPDMESWVVGAKLLIPEEKFVPVTNITLDVIGAKGYPADLNSGVKVFPEDASVTDVKWSIIGILPAGLADTTANWLNVPASDNAGLAAWRAANVDFEQVEFSWNPQKEQSYMDYSFLPPVKVILVPAGTPITKTINSDSAIISQKAGKVKVRATIVEGGKDEKDFTKDLFLTVADVQDPATFAIEVTGKAVTSTLASGAITVASRYRLNSGDPEWNVSTTATASYKKLYKDTDGTWFVQDGTDYFELDGTTAYTPTTTDFAAAATSAKNSPWDGAVSGGSFWVLFRATLPATTTLGDYSGLVFTFKGVAGDSNWKEPVKIALFKDTDTLPESTTWANPAHNDGIKAKVIDEVALEDISGTGKTVTIPLRQTSTTQNVYFLFYYNVPGWDSTEGTAYSIGGIKYVEKVN